MAIKALLTNEMGQNMVDALHEVAGAVAYASSSNADDNSTSVVMEQSSNPKWTRGGNLYVVDRILNKYGSYVIDEDNKKYAKLDPSNHSQFVDGTAWDGTWGNCFRRLPKVYFKVDKNDDGQSVLHIAMYQIDDTWHSWDESWIGNYKGYVDSDGKLRSIPAVRATGTHTMTEFWNYAQALGTQYGLTNYPDHCKLNALHLCKFGDANSENTMGKGLQDAGWNAEYYNPTLGVTAALGDDTGSMAYNSSYNQNKLFGIEALAGSQWEFRPNIRFSGSTAIVYEGNIVSDTASGREFTRLESASGDYVTAMKLGDYFDMIPTAIGGSASTYYCDGAWASSGGQLLVVGGSSYYGSHCGLSCSNSSDDFSYSSAHFGARLSFRGDISEYDFVSGADLAALHA